MSTTRHDHSERPQAENWPLLPTETEIYILPSGEVVVADLPAELADAIQRAGLATPQHGTTGVMPADAPQLAEPGAAEQPEPTGSVSEVYDNQ